MEIREPVLIPQGIPGLQQARAALLHVGTGRYSRKVASLDERRT